MEAFEAIMTRRSTRKMKEEVPSRDLIEKVIEAGRYAPSGGNSQTTARIGSVMPPITRTTASSPMRTSEKPELLLELVPVPVWRSGANPNASFGYETEMAYFSPDESEVSKVR